MSDEKKNNKKTQTIKLYNMFCIVYQDEKEAIWSDSALYFLSLPNVFYINFKWDTHPFQFEYLIHINIGASIHILLRYNAYVYTFTFNLILLWIFWTKDTKHFEVTCIYIRYSNFLSKVLFTKADSRTINV